MLKITLLIPTPMCSKLFTFPSNLALTPNPQSHLFPNYITNPSPLSWFPLKSQLSHFFKIPHHHRHNPLLATPQINPTPSQDDQSQELITRAREAFSAFLRQELGVSEEDSAAIAAGSPRYLQMLVDGVRELDEMGLWGPMRGGSGEDEAMWEFEDKVGRMAMEKGDAGKVAFLESFVGLSLSSAMNIARYLNADPIPNLIAKVKYMKDIFFSGSNDGRLIGKNARRMMMHLSISVDEDVQQTLSFFEKIEAKRGGLDLLGSNDTSFRYLVESFPRLLVLPMETRMNTIMGFLEDVGISGESLRNMLLLFPPIMFYDIEVIKTRMLALKETGVEGKDIGKMVIKYPWILSTSIQKNYKLLIFFFETEKVPKVSFDHGIRSWPHVLGSSSSKIKLIVDEIGKLGVRNKKLGPVICKIPQILLRKPQEFTEMVSVFEELGFNKDKIAQILCRCPEIFATRIETLKRKIKVLAAIGISSSHLPRVIKKYPELLVSDIDRTILPRMRYLMKLGLSKRDVSFMVRRFSPLLGYSIEEVIRPKIDFLVNTMEKPIRDVVDYPRFFSYSLEKKIKPRYWILRQRKIECTLQDMLAQNDEEFALKFLNDERTQVPHDA